MAATLTTRIKQEAVRLGFDLVGVARARPAPRAERFREWLDAGRQGDMSWLARDPERRSDPTRVLPGARSMVVAGLSYFITDPPEDVWSDPLRGRIARYAWGRDYHDEMLPMLDELAEFIRAEAGSATVCRTYVDTGPVLERETAERAGLGFVGKNSLLINTRMGSYIFIGEILTNAELDCHDEEPRTAQEEGTCGQCRRCLDICPTHAFPAPYILDSRLCISYLTIELKGEIPENLRPLMKNWIYGCDECQSICPWVRKSVAPKHPRFLKNDPDIFAPRLIDLMAMSEQEFSDRFRGTPIYRTKRRGLLRNVAVALGNSGRREALASLERATDDPEPLIRAHAAWALGRIGNKS